MEYVPDPRTVIEDENDAKMYEREAEERAQRAEEERLIKAAQEAARKEEKAKKREALLLARKEGDVDKDDDEEEGDEDEEERSQRSGSEPGSASDASKSRSRSKKFSKSDSVGPSGKSGMYNSDDDDGLEEDEDMSDEYDGVGELPKQEDMKRELIAAIEDEGREYEQLKK